MDSEETAFAQVMVGLESARSVQERQFYTEKLTYFRPLAERRAITVDMTDYITNWYNVVILEMFNLQGFVPSAEWIGAHLGAAVSRAEIDTSLALLARLKMIEATPSGSLTRVEAKLSTSTSVPGEAIKTFHRQMLGLATAALSEQTAKTRYFTGTTISIDANRVDEAFRLIEDFRNKFIQLTQASEATATYHFAVQFFRLASSDERAAPPAVKD